MSADEKKTIVWFHQSYQSGTQIVTCSTKEPYYYIYGEDDKHRSLICKDLVAWCNGGDRPAWLEDLVLSDEENEVIGHSDLRIFTTGPMVLPPDDNGRFNWTRCESANSKRKRKALIDAILDKNNPRPNEVLGL